MLVDTILTRLSAMCGDEEGRVFIIPEPTVPEIKDSRQAFALALVPLA